MGHGMVRHRLPATASARGWQKCATCVMVSGALVSTGCATVVTGRTQLVAVSSEPSGAQVFVGDEPVGVTPTFVDLPRRERNLTLRFEKEGFAPVDASVRRSLSGWLWGNAAYTVTAGVTAGQAIGHRTTAWAHMFPQLAAFTFGIDLLTGAAFRLPRHVRATLPTTPDNPGPRAGTSVPTPAREGIVLPAARPGQGVPHQPAANAVEWRRR